MSEWACLTPDPVYASAGFVPPVWWWYVFYIYTYIYLLPLFMLFKKMKSIVAHTHIHTGIPPQSSIRMVISMCLFVSWLTKISGSYTKKIRRILNPLRLRDLRGVCGTSFLFTMSFLFESCVAQTNKHTHTHTHTNSNFPPCENQTKCGLSAQCDNKGVDCSTADTSVYWNDHAPFPTSNMNALRDPQTGTIRVIFRGFNGKMYENHQVISGNSSKYVGGVIYEGIFE